MITLGRRGSQGLLVGTGFIYVNTMFMYQGSPRAKLVLRAREGAEDSYVDAAGEGRVYQLAAGISVELLDMNPKSNHLKVTVKAAVEVPVLRFELLTDVQLLKYVPLQYRPGVVGPNS